MKNYLVSLFIMIVFVIVGAGSANACVIEKATDVDIGAIELATETVSNSIVMGDIDYDYLLTSKVSTPHSFTYVGYNYPEVVTPLEVDIEVDIEVDEAIKVKPFYLSLYNDDHRSDWLNKESLKTVFDTDRQNQNTAYRRLRRVQHRQLTPSC